MRFLENWRQQRVQRQAAIDAVVQRQSEELANHFNAQNAATRQDVIRKMRVQIGNHVIEIVNKTGGIAGVDAAVENRTQVMVWANTIAKSHMARHKETYAQEISDSYRYILVLYLKKRLTQLKDNIQASDFTDYVSLDQQSGDRARRHKEQMKEILSGHGLERPADDYSKLSQPSMAVSAADRCKKDCDSFTVALNRKIDTHFSHLKGKTITELNVQLDQNLLAFIFGDDSGVNPKLAPRI